MRDGPAPVIGLQEIAELFGTTKGTVGSWRTRGDLVEEDWKVSGAPVWLPATVRAWAKRTGRLDESGGYKKPTTGRRPLPPEERAKVELAAAEAKVKQLKAKLRP